MAHTQTLTQPAPFIALALILACGLAAIAALGVSLLIGGSLQSLPMTQAPAPHAVQTSVPAQ
ncbi:hypothetical protein D3248_11900 [Leucobacter zeae]|nr:hypothetical protein [Leucobacter zeae]